MSKKWIIVIIFVVIAIGAGILGAIFLIQNNKSQTSKETGSLSDSLSKIIPQAKKEAVLKKHTDEAGFSFSYPDTVTVVDNTPEEGNYYSLLNLSQGSIKATISLEDTKAKTVEEYLKSNSKYANLTLSGATSFGGISAKEYEDQSSKYIFAIDQGVLYIFEYPNNEEWIEVFDKIIETFAFKGEEKTTTSQKSAPAESVIYEEEEVIE